MVLIFSFLNNKGNASTYVEKKILFLNIERVFGFVVEKKSLNNRGIFSILNSTAAPSISVEK